MCGGRLDIAGAQLLPCPSRGSALLPAVPMSAPSDVPLLREGAGTSAGRGPVWDRWRCKDERGFPYSTGGRLSWERGIAGCGVWGRGILKNCYVWLTGERTRVKVGWQRRRRDTGTGNDGSGFSPGESRCHQVGRSLGDPPPSPWSPRFAGHLNLSTPQCFELHREKVRTPPFLSCPLTSEGVTRTGLPDVLSRIHFLLELGEALLPAQQKYLGFA